MGIRARHLCHLHWLLVAIGCTAPGDLDPNALGIASLDIQRAGGTLTIEGFDEAGASKALVTVRSGTVYFSRDWVEGTELTLAAGDDRLVLAAPGFYPHTKPAPALPALDALVRIDAIAREIGREGITFAAAPAPGGEVAYDATACSGAQFASGRADGSSRSSPAQCCQDGTDQWLKPNAVGLLMNRQRSPTGAACRASDGSSDGCTGKGCYYGPCGFAMIGPPLGNSNAVVFAPVLTGYTNRCGRDDDGVGDGGGYWPEAYATHCANPDCSQVAYQNLYAGVGATCQYTWCVNGNPTFGDRTLNLSVLTSGGTGTVAVDRASYPSLSGAMSAGSFVGYYHLSQSVTLTATPAATSFVQWAGACSGTGALGQRSSCVVPMALAASVQVTWGTSSAASGGCFVAGTQITMASGQTKSIEDIQIGDRVLSFDEASGRTVAGEVVHTFVHHDKQTVRINGSLRTTLVHPFYVDGKWVPAGELAPGDRLYRFDALFGAPAETLVPTAVMSIESEGRAETVYNFEVRDYHDYFAGGLLVHNKKALVQQL